MQLNINGHLVESPIQLVMALLAARQFIDPPEEDVAEGETVIGTLTDEEIAIYSAAEMIADVNNALFRDAEKNGEQPTRELLRKFGTFRKWTDYLMQSMFWPDLNLRFDEELSKFKSNGVGEIGITLRSRWQVTVSGPERSPSFGLAAMLAAMAVNGRQAAAHEHNCAECPIYDECSLPMKQPQRGGMPQPVWPDDGGDTEAHH